MRKNIVVMTKSYKHGGYCIAGIDDLGQWVRLVSNDTKIEGAIHKNSIFYSNFYGEVEVLDYIEVDIIKNLPKYSQPENYLIDYSKGFKFIKKINLDAIIRNRGYDKTDLIFSTITRKIKNINTSDNRSLLFLKVYNVIFNYYYIEQFDSYKYEMSFEYGGYKYERFSISDIKMRKKLYTKGFGEWFVDSCDVVFSLTDKYEHDEMYYKMAAQIFITSNNISNFK